MPSLSLTWQSILRNKLVSLGVFATTLLVSLFLFVLSSVGVLVEAGAQQTEGQLDITLFLKSGISVDNSLVLELDTRLEAMGLEADVLSSREALATLQEDSDLPELINETVAFLEEYQGGQVLQPLITVRGFHQGGVDQVVSLLQEPVYEGILDFSYFDEQVKRLAAFSSLSLITRTVFLVLYLLLAGVAVLILLNTTRILLYTRKKEVEVMELVGASRKVIEQPFYLEMILLSLLGVLASFGVYMAFLLQFQVVGSVTSGAVSGVELLLSDVSSLLLRYMGSSWFIELLKMLALFGVVAWLGVRFALKQYLPKL